MGVDGVRGGAADVVATGGDAAGVEGGGEVGLAGAADEWAVLISQV